MFDWKGKFCLVLGGAGWVGSHIVDILLARGARVVVMDNLSVGRKENVPAVEVIEMDITNWPDRESPPETRTFDFIFNSVCMDRLKSDRSEKDRRMSWQVNANAVERLFSELNCGCWVQISSSSVYGSCHDADEGTPFRITSMYAAGKAAADCVILAGRLDRKVVIARLSNVYGPRRTKKDDYCQVVNTFVQEMLENKRCILNGSSVTRDFIYAEDAASAITMLAEKRDMDLLLHDVYNISGEVRTLAQVWSTVKDVVQHKGISPHHTTFTEGVPEQNDIESRYVNSNRIREELGWSPRGFQNGIEATVEWFLKNESRWKE